KNYGGFMDDEDSDAAQAWHQIEIELRELQELTDVYRDDDFRYQRHGQEHKFAEYESCRNAADSDHPEAPALPLEGLAPAVEGRGEHHCIGRRRADRDGDAEDIAPDHRGGRLPVPLGH